VRVIERESYRAMPWKNGGGVTHEIARSDDEPSPQWRISLATLEGDGPFSDFAGYDRTIVPIEGAFALTFEGGRCVQLDGKSEPFRFAGEERVECKLDGGTSRDLNIMTQRSAWSHAVDCKALEWDELNLPAGTHKFVFVLDGSLEVFAETGAPLVLRAGDTLECDEKAHPALLAHDAARLLVIELVPA